MTASLRTFSQSWNKPMRMLGMGMAFSTTQADSLVPIWETGEGVPTHDRAAGSVYVNVTTGTMYLRQGSSWVGEVVNNTVADAAVIAFGDGADLSMGWDATKFAITQAAPNSAIHFGVSGAGIDLNLFGDTATRDVTWDQSLDSLIFADNAKLGIGSGAGAGADIVLAWDATKLVVTQLTTNSAIHFGISGAGIDLNLFGDTATYDVTWDQSLDSLIFADNAKLGIGAGAGAGADIVFAWDATRLNVTQLTVNSEVRWGVDGAGLDQRWYGDTASADLLWDQSLDALVFEGVASARGLRTSSTTAAAISGATVLTLADSGGVFSVAQSSTYDIDLPSPTTGPGCRYVFYLTGPAAFSPTITVLGGAATFVGAIINDVTSVLPATGNTLTFVTGTATLGDTIEIISISTSLYLVRAVSSTAGGITIS